MPIYAFKCSACSHEYEALVPRMGATASCPKCDSKKVEKLLTAPADYRSDSSSSGQVPPCATGQCSTGQCPFG